MSVIEVGVGGTYDATNIIENPLVCGISSLGIDHVSILGNSISEIAWHKSGIFKVCNAIIIFFPQLIITLFSLFLIIGKNIQ